MNSSIQAEVEFGMVVRGYDTDILVPEKIAINKSYEGKFKVILDVKEDILISMHSPDELIVIPQSQMVTVTPEEPGLANFTFLASKAGEYPLTFQLLDSHGIPMPEETATIVAAPPEGLAVLTGDDIIYGTIGTLALFGNRSPSIFMVPADEISDDYLQRLQSYLEIVILGNGSVIPSHVEKKLKDIELKRIQSDSLFEESWLFTKLIWDNGTSNVVLTTPREADIFRAYKIAMNEGLPMVVCRGNVTGASIEAIEEMTRRNTTLSRAMVVGRVEEDYTKALREAGVLLEEVSA
jgi:hypothetical protein